MESRDLEAVALEAIKTSIADGGIDISICREHDVGNDDFLLLRFLRARNFNPEQALRMLTEDITWRTEMRAQHDSLLSETPTEILGCDPSIIHPEYPQVSSCGLIEFADPLIDSLGSRLFGAILSQWPHGADRLGRPVLFAKGTRHELVFFLFPLCADLLTLRSLPFQHARDPPAHDHRTNGPLPHLQARAHGSSVSAAVGAAGPSDRDLHDRD
jgi:hypothetical protein